MVSTKDAPGPFDGLEKAVPGEPIFTLCAHDPLAAPLVRQWVDLRRKAIIQDHELDAAKRRIELLQCVEADDVAQAMDDWRMGRVVEEEAKVEKAPTYSGNEASEEQLEMNDKIAALDKVATMLGNATALINDAAELLDAQPQLIGVYSAHANDLRAVVEGLKVKHEAVRPKRGYIDRPELSAKRGAA